MPVAAPDGELGDVNLHLPMVSSEMSILIAASARVAAPHSLAGERAARRRGTGVYERCGGAVGEAAGVLWGRLRGAAAAAAVCAAACRPQPAKRRSLTLDKGPLCP